MFITTANLIHTILPALRDRMEIIEIPGYTEKEKLEIAKRYLIPRQIKEHGLKEEDIKITDEAINHIIKAYTREAGIRNLEREISAICRGIAKKVATGEIEKKEIDKDDLKEFLGVEKYRYELANEKDEIGVATGLAWTEVGGDVLFVEAILVPGKGNIILTGHLGDVMQESAKAAVTYARSKEIVKGVKINPDVFLTKDIHIHVPSGAIPKDGPSAGVTMATSLISTLIGRPVKKEIAMTGEITLRGKVLPVGGIKEKVLAAHRAGIKTVILPKENEKDLEEVPEIAKENLKFVFVENVDEILEIAIS
jgi:ATP-dependent Lon protease